MRNFSLLAFSFFSSLAMAQELPAPIAPQVPHSTTMFGDTRQDPYWWMITYPGHEHSPQIMDYLTAENEYTAAHFKPLENLRKKIAAEIRAKAGTPEPTPPEEIGQYTYYQRQASGQNYPSLYRKSLRGGPEELVIDAEAQAKNFPYYSFEKFRMNPNGDKIAWMISIGSLQSSIYLKDLKSGIAEEIVKGTAGAEDIVWSSDGKFLFYSLYDSQRRKAKVMRHALGTSTTFDTLVYEEKDLEYELRGVTRSRDGKFIFITTQREDLTTEVFFQAADDNALHLTSFGDRRAGQSYSVEHQGNSFYILSNHESPNQGLYEVNDARPDRAQWKPVLLPRAERALTDLFSFQNHLVIMTQENGVPQVQILNLQDNTLTPVHFNEPLYEVTLHPFAPDINVKFERNSIYIKYDSMTVADRTYSYDFETKKLTILQDSQSRNFDSAKFKTKRILVTARDGVKVPVTLLYRADVKFDGKAPLFLSAYGNYGYNFSLSFPSMYNIPTVAPLVNRGVIVAIASVRGGGEMGPQWGQDGKLQKKKNTFYDFIDVAEHLEAHHYTNPSRLGVRGISAAGLWLGFVTNNRPELFKAVIARSPFVDILNTELDDKIPLTTQEWTQWGNPNHQSDYEYIKSYSPYDNVGAHDYPAMLVQGSLKDNQVMVHEPAKWVARIRSLKTDHNELLFKVNMTGSHGGDSGVTGESEDESYDISWLIHQLGVPE